MTSLIVQDESAFGPPDLHDAAAGDARRKRQAFPTTASRTFFRYAGSVATTKGNHRLSSGFGVTREQLNGIESSGHLGMIMFNSDFGRDMITNLRLGTPSRITQSIGNAPPGAFAGGGCSTMPPTRGARSGI